MRHRLFFIYASCFFVGVCIYFLLPIEPDLDFVMLCAISASICYALSYFISKTRILFIALLVFTMGFSISSYRTHHIASPIYSGDQKPVSIWATLERYEKQEHGLRVWLTDNNLWQRNIGVFSEEDTPNTIRLNVRTKMDERVQTGDRIQVKAILTPPPLYPAYPGGYNFSRYAYFQQIGAVGYTISPILPKDDKVVSHHFFDIIESVRHDIREHIEHSISDPANASIATALLTGQRRHIPKDVIESVRLSGLGHLLAISGLHMSLVMMGCYVLFRRLFALSEYASNYLPTKKIACILALLVGGNYLLITGLPVSAIRAYVMVSIFFIAILFDRLSSPLRPVFIAAIGILCFTPEAIVTPGFQMSFAAVTALVASYDWWRQRKRAVYFQQRSLLYKLLFYLIGIIITSFIAGFATTPFALYHFGRMTHYSLLANLFAIPLTTLWIMPSGILSLLLMPIGLESYPLMLMGLGIEKLIHNAQLITDLPHSYSHISVIPTWSIMLFTLAGLWLILSHGKWRSIGILGILCSLYGMSIPHKTPDILVDESGKLFALKGTDGTLYFSNLNRARFARKQWAEAQGQPRTIKIRDVDPDIIQPFSCNPSYCIGRYEHATILLIKPLGVFTTDSCMEFNGMEVDLLIHLKPDITPCETIKVKRLIDLDFLASEGTSAISVHSNVKVTTSKQKLGDRLWTRAHAQAKNH